LISLPCKRFEAGDLVERNIGEDAQEAAHVAVVGVAPELPEIVVRQHLFVQPDRAVDRLAHLGAVGGGQQLGGRAEQFDPVHPAGQFDAVDDVAPLVRPAELQPAAMAQRQFAEVVGLKDHVVEFEEGQRLFAIEAQLDQIEGQHAIDREMRADRAQHRYSPASRASRRC
jgi:hypothetical protein